MASRGCFLAAVLGFLIAVSSLVVKHGFEATQASVVPRL